MDQFIPCICDNNYDGLIVSGRPNIEELVEAWLTVFYEYCDLIGSEHTKRRMKLIAEIARDEKIEEFAQGWINILSINNYNMPIVSALRIVGFEYELNPDDPQQFDLDLRRINAELMSLRFNIKIKKAKLEEMMLKQVTQAAIGKKYFTTIFFRINNYARRDAVNGQTYVENYCAALRDYEEAKELQQAQLKAQENARGI